MLINLLNYLSISNFFIYDTFFRAFFALLTSFFIFFTFAKKVIFLFNKFNIKQTIRIFGPSTHFVKNKTPTMGGVLILFSIIISIILWSDIFNIYVLFFIFVFLGYGFIGFLDDFLKIKNKNFVGLNAKWKYFLQSFLAFLVAFFLYKTEYKNTIFYFFKNSKINLDFFYIFMIYFVLVGSSNAVNLTDGLDGLVTVPIIFVSSFLSFLSWISSDLIFSVYFNIPYIKEANELVIICFSIIGSSLGFLWFNSYPSQIFMGDTGSISIGSSLGMIAILLRQEFLFFIISGVFIIETISVILQILFFRMFKIRIFKMAPIHHHYELHGIPEIKIVVRFWIVSFVFLLLGIIMLKVLKIVRI